MNLSHEYIQWQFKAINRGQIVQIVDREILNGNFNEGSLLDLSLSCNLDDYEFEKLFKRFVDLESFGQADYFKIARANISECTDGSIPDLLNGLFWLIYDMEIFQYGHPLHEIYCYIDHYYTELDPKDRHPLIKKYIRNWLAENSD
jgi:hypothetical protein